MSNYDTSDSTSSRVHSQSNPTNSFSTRIPFFGNQILNTSTVETQKLSNMNQSIPQNLFYNPNQYSQQQNYYIAQQLMFSNNQQMVPHQYTQNFVTFNNNPPPANNVYSTSMDRIVPTQQYILMQNNAPMYQSQPTQMPHQMSSHIHPQSIAHIPQSNQTSITQHMHQQTQQIPPYQMQSQQIPPSLTSQQQQQQQQQLMQPHQMQHQMQQQQQHMHHYQQMQPQPQQPPMQLSQHHSMQTKQMQPHIRPQFSTNQFSPVSTSYRQPSPSVIPPEKPIKTSLALDIINPDTLERIDLHAFETVKTKETLKIDNNINKIKNNELVASERRIVLDLPVTLYEENDNLEITIDDNNEVFDKDREDINGQIVTEDSVATSVVEELINSDVVVNKTDAQTQNDVISNNGDVYQRFIYTREELINIGKSDLSRIKPKDLPFKDKFTDPIILDYPNNVCFNHFESMPGMNQKHSKVIKKFKDENNINDLQSINRNQQGLPSSWRHNTSKNSSLPRYIDLGVHEVPLMRSEDGYVTFKQRLASGEELNQTEELVRQIKGILNRIVPQNFDQCLNDLVSLKVGTHEGMTCLVNELFLKAVKEEAYSVTFAKICSYLASIKADVNENEIVTFRSVLLQKCQAMFTTPLEEQLEKVRQDWLLKASIEKPKTKALMESDVEEQVKKAKDRYYGNIRFIGELYLKGVLITKIICFCIENLMSKENDSDSLICLCKLLETCGSKLETESKGKDKLNDACHTLRDFTDSQNIETRVRFRILDILEMRDKKWSLRKVQQEQKIEPKTLEEIKLEKEMEDEKDFYHSLNRRNQHNWNIDRRQSLPTVSKNRSSITPKQLSVNSLEPTTLGPMNRNWMHGSGYKSKCDSIDFDKRTGKPKPRIGLNGSDISQIVENYEVVVDHSNDADNECVVTESLPIPACDSPSNSSTNSSRSSSNCRSVPAVLSKEKLSDSSLTQAISVELIIFNPDQLLKEHMTTNFFCTNSWNSYEDKVTVVYKWLDKNFDTNSDKRRSLSNLLSVIINQGVLDKDDLLKAFAKLLDFLEDLLIDVGNALWDSLMDYLIPFIESMDMSSIDIVENIFNTGVFQNFCRENASIIYSLPWSMINGILKMPYTRIDQDIFKLAIDFHTREKLSDCNIRLISIIEINILKAISIKLQMSSADYEIWLNVKMKETMDRDSLKYFFMINAFALLSTITPKMFSDEKLKASFKKLCSLCSPSDVFQALINLSHKHEHSVEDIVCKLWYLIKSGIYEYDTIVVDWQSESLTRKPLSSNLQSALTFIESKGAFIIQSCDSFQRLLSFDEGNINVCSTTSSSSSSSSSPLLFPSTTTTASATTIIDPEKYTRSDCY